MRITKLDGLRGFFSLMVVFYHYVVIFAENNTALLPDFLNNNFLIRESYTFVDFFFVLSGFLITLNYNSLQSASGFRVFLKKRFIRLYPLLLFTSILYFIFELVVNNFFTQLVAEPVSSGFIIKKTIDTLLFLNSTPVFTDTKLGINSPSWSISSEMISYIVVGLIFLGQNKKRKTILLVLLLCMSALFLIIKGVFFATGDYGFVRGLISFIIGYFVWRVAKMNFKVSNLVEAALPIGLVTILYILNVSSEVEKEMLGLILIPMFFGLCILFFVKSSGWVSKFLESKPLQFLGKISYSVYLNHFLIIVIFPRAIFKALHLSQNPLSEMIVFLAVMLFIIVYSYYTYKYIEVKGGKYFRTLLFPAKPQPLVYELQVEEVLKP